MNTYYLTAKFKILYAIISILIFAILFKIFTPNYVCLGIYGAFILVTSFKNIIGEKTVISDKGIEYHRLALTFSTKWENVRKLDTQWFKPFEQEGISLVADQIRITEWWPGNYKAYGDGVESHLSHFQNFPKTGATPNSDNKSSNTRHNYLKKNNPRKSVKSVAKII